MCWTSSQTASANRRQLEAVQPAPLAKWHRSIIREGEDPEPHMAALYASGEAKDGDRFILRTIIAPAQEVAQ